MEEEEQEQEEEEDITMIFKLILKISKGTYLSWLMKWSIFELLEYHKK
jgi:hypothetical protein